MGCCKKNEDENICKMIGHCDQTKVKEVNILEEFILGPR